MLTALKVCDENRIIDYFFKTNFLTQITQMRSLPLKTYISLDRLIKLVTKYIFFKVITEFYAQIFNKV